MSIIEPNAIITLLLSYMDKPWKIIGLITLVFFGIIAFTMYERRLQIATAILNNYGIAHLELGKFKEQAPILLKASHAYSTVLLRLSLESNWVQPIAGYSHSGAEWLPDPGPRPLIHLSTSSRTIIEIINGQPVCNDVEPDNPLLKKEYAVGIRHICTIGVPPYTGAMVGLLTVAWDIPPSPTEEYLAIQSLRATALKIATW